MCEEFVKRAKSNLSGARFSNLAAYVVFGKYGIETSIDVCHFDGMSGEKIEF